MNRTLCAYLVVSVRLCACVGMLDGFNGVGAPEQKDMGEESTNGKVGHKIRPGIRTYAVPGSQQR